MVINSYLNLLTTKAASDTEGVLYNAHRFDSEIMTQWPSIRQQAISDGLFGSNDTQAELFVRIKQGFNNLNRLNEVLERVEQKFVTRNDGVGVLVDAFGEDYKYEAHTAVNPLEFWLVMRDYVAFEKNLNPDFENFEQIIYDSVNESPSGGGYVANVFANTALQHYIKKLRPAVVGDDSRPPAVFSSSIEAINTPILCSEMKRQKGEEHSANLPAPGDNLLKAGIALEAAGMVFFGLGFIPGLQILWAVSVVSFVVGLVIAECGQIKNNLVKQSPQLEPTVSARPPPSAHHNNPSISR